MAPKKKSVKQEPFLNSMARKLGHAAGTLTKVTHDLTDNVTTLTESVATKVQEVTSASGAERTPARTKPAKQTRKRAHSVAGARSKKSRSSGTKRAAKTKARRSSR
jgi:hypothetical protein